MASCKSCSIEADGQRSKDSRRFRYVVGALCLLAAACSGDEVASPMQPQRPAVIRLAATSLGSLNRLAAESPGADVGLQIDFDRLVSDELVVRAASVPGVTLVGLSHGFRDGSDVQIGGYDMLIGGGADAWLAAYRGSTGEFLRNSVRLAGEALAGEHGQDRTMYQHLRRTFVRRLAHFEKHGASVYSVRLRGSLSAVNAVAHALANVRGLSLRRAGQQHRQAILPTDLRIGVQMYPIDRCLDETTWDPSCDPPPPPPPEDPPMVTVVPQYSASAVPYEVPNEYSPWDDNTYSDDFYSQS